MLRSRLKCVIPEAHGSCVFIRASGELHTEQNCLHAPANSYQLLLLLQIQPAHYRSFAAVQTTELTFLFSRSLIIARRVTAWPPSSSQNRYRRLHLLSAMSLREKRVIGGLRWLFLMKKWSISDLFWGLYSERNTIFECCYLSILCLKKLPKKK